MEPGLSSRERFVFAGDPLTTSGAPILLVSRRVRRPPRVSNGYCKSIYCIPISYPINILRMPPMATVPSPGVPKPDEIFDPVGRGLDVIGDRWTLLLIR